jgi:hypothetical protein
LKEPRLINIADWKEVEDLLISQSVAGEVKGTVGVGLLFENENTTDSSIKQKLSTVNN